MSGIPGGSPIRKENNPYSAAHEYYGPGTHSRTTSRARTYSLVSLCRQPVLIFNPLLTYLLQSAAPSVSDRLRNLPGLKTPTRRGSHGQSPSSPPPLYKQS